MGALTHNGEVMQGLPADASQINFDKTGTDLNSTQTENAIKEVNTKANTNAADITQLKSGLANKIDGYSLTSENIDAAPNNYSIGLGLVNNTSYIAINTAWVSWQLSIGGDGKLYRRLKYGQSEWSQWVEI